MKVCTLKWHHFHHPNHRHPRRIDTAILFEKHAVSWSKLLEDGLSLCSVDGPPILPPVVSHPPCVELTESKHSITHKDWNQEAGWRKRPKGIGGWWSCASFHCSWQESGGYVAVRHSDLWVKNPNILIHFGGSICHRCCIAFLGLRLLSESKTESICLWRRCSTVSWNFSTEISSL